MPCASATIKAPSEEDGGSGGGELSPWEFWNNLSDNQKLMVGAGALASAGFIAISVRGGGQPVGYTNRTVEDQGGR